MQHYFSIIDLGKPSYVNGVILKIFFGRKSIVHNIGDDDNDDNGTTKNITLNITLCITLCITLNITLCITLHTTLYMNSEPRG